MSLEKTVLTDSVVSELETLIHEREERINNKDND